MCLFVRGGRLFISCLLFISNVNISAQVYVSFAIIMIIIIIIFFYSYSDTEPHNSGQVVHSKHLCFVVVFTFEITVTIFDRKKFPKSCCPSDCGFICHHLSQTEQHAVVWTLEKQLEWLWSLMPPLAPW